MWTKCVCFWAWVCVCVCLCKHKAICVQCDGQPQYLLYLTMNVTLVRLRGDNKGHHTLKLNKQMNTRSIFNATHTI